MVRPAASEKRRGVAPWAMGVAALVLIGVLFGGFYAYQKRNNSSAVAEPTPAPEGATNTIAQPSPTTEHAGSKPTSGQIVDEKKTATPDRVAAAKDKSTKSMLSRSRRPRRTRLKKRRKKLSGTMTLGDHPLSLSLREWMFRLRREQTPARGNRYPRSGRCRTAHKS